MSKNIVRGLLIVLVLALVSIPVVSSNGVMHDVMHPVGGVVDQGTTPDQTPDSLHPVGGAVHQGVSGMLENVHPVD